MTSTIVIGEGRVSAVAGGPLDLSELGPRTTRRLSHVEFNPETQRWEVRDPNGNRLADFAAYDAALTWERDYFNANAHLL